MIRRLIALAGALWLSGCGAPADSGREWSPPSPALWEVVSPQGRQGWLFGTIHALPDNVDWRTATLDQVAANAGVLLVEVADLGSPDIPQHFQQISNTPGQPDLIDRVDPDHRPAIATLMDTAGIPASHFRNVETWAASLMLGNAVARGNPQNGVDRALIAQAAAVREVEGYRAQFRIFDTLPEEEQSDLLELTAVQALGADYEATVEAWLTGDLDNLLPAGLLADEELYAALLADRNADWLPAIMTAIANGEAPLVAVGAGHMVGADGLPALLEREGYSVRRIQ